MEGMTSRKRRPNWMDPECLLLAQLTHARKSIIRGKCTTGVSIQDKRRAWEEIAQAINTAFPESQRTVSDCNKKWENLLAKSREEIKRQKMRAGTESLSIDALSAVTQVVISVMNLQDVKQEDNGDMKFADIQQNSCDEDGNDVTLGDNKHALKELRVHTFADPSTSPAEQKMNAFTFLPKSLAAQFPTPRPADFTVPVEQLDDSCLASSPSANCTALQERMDLEMSVLRRQEAVLKLQEEYYTLKIERMKRQMKEPLLKDWE